ncbi:MAG: hypothetical protein R2705_00740 [Ilumatobacteraceae bacterium]
MNEPVTPSNVAKPAANYALAMRSTGPTTWVHTSGVLGHRPDGSLPTTVGEQAAEMWRSIAAILEASDWR